jgi:uncharacterized protein YndB with AHSA1/START domain
MAAAIEQEILIDAPVDVVWRTVTEPDQISRWFVDDVDVEIAPDAVGAVTFRETPTGPRTFNVKVVSVEPQRSWAYRWNHPEGVEATAGNSTLVEFTLTAEGERTRLRVVETGVEQTSWSPQEQDEYAADHNRGWTTIVGRLAELLADERVAS